MAYFSNRAAVCIQRYWRKYKGVKFHKLARTRAGSSKSSLHKSPTPAVPTTKVLMSLPDAPPSTADAVVKPETAASQRPHLDYDTYLKNRRPGSKSPSIVSSVPHGERRMIGRFGQTIQELQVGENTQNKTTMHHCSVTAEKIPRRSHNPLGTSGFLR